MFGRTIWHKLPECIFENFEIARVKRGQIQNFENPKGWFILKSPEPNMWLLLITPNQQTLCIETNIFQQRGITK